MGVLEKPDTASLSETAAPAATTIAYNAARLVIALLSLFVAVLYLDVFTLKGLRLFVREYGLARTGRFEPQQNHAGLDSLNAIMFFQPICDTLFATGKLPQSRNFTCW